MLNKTEIIFSPLFFAYFAFLCALNGGQTALAALLSIIAHELAHIVAMVAFGARIRCVSFLASRVRIDSDADLHPKASQTLIFLAGPVANVVLGVILLCFSRDAATLNFALAAFNLLPIAALDGGRVFALFMPRVVALVVSLVFTFALAVFMFYGVLLYKSIPFALLTFMAVLAVVDGKI